MVRTSIWIWLLALASISVAGCSATAPAEPALLPADYPAAFSEVRACGQSVDHDLAYVLVKASAEAADIYRQGPFPFSAGAVIVKEQYGDPGCKSLTGFTLMRKEAAGHDPAGGDWQWQRLDARRRATDPGQLRRCASCHADR
jgi:hypothetical protein